MRLLRHQTTPAVSTRQQNRENIRKFSSWGMFSNAPKSRFMASYGEVNRSGEDCH